MKSRFYGQKHVFKSANSLCLAENEPTVRPITTAIFLLIDWHQLNS
jgi:hypothetical protein